MGASIQIDDKDSLLLSQLKRGSEKAFSIFYQSYSKMLYTNILSLVKDREIAQEILQDLFLKVWEKREAINIDKSFKAYLFTIAKNSVYDYFRKVSLDKKLKEKLIKTTLEYYSHTDEDINYKEKNDCFELAIKTLSPQTQIIYKLSKIEELSHQEISEKLKISQSTVNNHMVKANKIIKNYIQNNSDLDLALIIIPTIYAFIK